MELAFKLTINLASDQPASGESPLLFCGGPEFLRLFRLFLHPRLFRHPLLSRHPRLSHPLPARFHFPPHLKQIRSVVKSWKVANNKGVLPSIWPKSG